MTNEADSRNTTHTTEQIEIMYRGYGKYYTEVVRAMSDKIFNWAFTLNTGALTATITFMAVAIRWKNFSSHDILPFLILMIIFGSGILSIVISAFLEQERFCKKGKLLDKYYENRENSEQFINKIPPPTNCYDTLVPLLEYLSYTLCFSGIIIAVIGILYKAKSQS
jgi:hypothetical protein